MNLEDIINAIVDIVVEVSTINHNLSPNMILGRCRKENVLVARCLLVSQLAASGYPTTTIAQAINRKPQTVRSIYRLSRTYHKSSKAYRIAEAQIQTRVRDLIGTNK